MLLEQLEIAHGHDMVVDVDLHVPLSREIWKAIVARRQYGLATGACQTGRIRTLARPPPARARTSSPSRGTAPPRSPAPLAPAHRGRACGGGCQRRGGSGPRGGACLALRR